MLLFLFYGVKIGYLTKKNIHCKLHFLLFIGETTIKKNFKNLANNRKNLLFLLVYSRKQRNHLAKYIVFTLNCLINSCCYYCSRNEKKIFI